MVVLFHYAQLQIRILHKMLRLDVRIILGLGLRRRPWRNKILARIVHAKHLWAGAISLKRSFVRFYFSQAPSSSLHACCSHTPRAGTSMRKCQMISSPVTGATYTMQRAGLRILSQHRGCSRFDPN